MDASIEHPGEGTKCRGWFILRLWVKGSLVGEDITVSTSGTDLFTQHALAIRIGNKRMQNGEEVAAYLKGADRKHKFIFSDERKHMSGQHLNRRKFAKLQLFVAGAILEINWFTGRKTPNSLDFRAKGLAHIGKAWGGLLGYDNHTWAAGYDPNCARAEDNDKFLNLVGVDDLEGPLFVNASLD